MGRVGLGLGDRRFDAFFVTKWLETRFWSNYSAKRWPGAVFWTVQRHVWAVFAVAFV